jgi:hypothetical protein
MQWLCFASCKKRVLDSCNLASMIRAITRASLIDFRCEGGGIKDYYLSNFLNI